MNSSALACDRPWHKLPLQGRRVLMRVDLNIRDNAPEALRQAWRMRALVPGLQEIVRHGARVGLLTHRGRPAGRPEPNLSTAPVAGVLSELLGQPVTYVPDCIGRVAQQAMAELKPGQVCLFENTRFHPGEVLNQQPFAAELAKLGEVLIFDAWATAHRAHASTSGLVGLMPEMGLGPLVLQEAAWLNRLLEPTPPMTLLLGGTQLGPKLMLLEHTLPRLKALLIGGVVAHTLLAAKDLPVPQQLVEPPLLESARTLLMEAGVLGCRLLLPHDMRVRTAEGLATRALTQINAQEIMGDIGPATQALWHKVVHQSDKLLWLGSPGHWQETGFEESLTALAESVRSASASFKLVAGDGLIEGLGVHSLIPPLQAAGAHISTGSAVLLAALGGQALPVWQVLARRGC